MTGSDFLLLGLSAIAVAAMFAALAAWAAIHINRTDKHLDEESKKLREKRLTLEAEMEIAYWHHRRDND